MTTTERKKRQPVKKAPASPPATTLKTAADLARQGVNEARIKAGEIVTATRQKGEDAIVDAREKAYRAADETNRMFQKHPIAAVAAAAAAGAVVGIFLPRLLAAQRAGALATRTGAIAVRTGGRASALAGRAAKLVATAETARSIISTLNQAGKTARSTALKGADAARAAAHVAAQTGTEAAREGIAHLPSPKAVKDAAEKVGEEVAGAARRAAQVARDAVKRG